MAFSLRSCGYLKLRPRDVTYGQSHAVEDTDGGPVHSRLALWKELPSWQQNGSHFIETGYRYYKSPYGLRALLIESFISNPLTIDLGAPLDPLENAYTAGLAFITNLVLNIYSHLLGSLLFLAIPIYVFEPQISPRFAVAAPADVAVCSIYFVGVSICFFLSAVYHTIMNHSYEYSKLGLQLDYQGIILLMWGATIPLIYYGFKCDLTLQKLHWILLSALAMVCSATTFQPRFRDASLQRAAIFGCFALSTALPILHGIIKYGVKIQAQRMGLIWVIVTLTLNILGASAYAIHVRNPPIHSFLSHYGIILLLDILFRLSGTNMLKYPEKWFPRRFDIFGASHQILHVMVVLAGLAHTFGIFQAFDFLHRHGDTCI